MTWEETIEFIRDKPEWVQIVDGCYFDADLVKNVERFRKNEEFKETVRIIRAISFALEGFEVTALEPDTSKTIGSGAIEKLKLHYKLDNVTVICTWGENMPFENNYFHIAYARQCMHHAHDLDKFVAEAARVLTPAGIYFAVRDHIVNDDKQLSDFLQIHPLHKYYGGEHAYSFERYCKAIKSADLKLVKVYKHLQNVILTDQAFPPNYFKDQLASHVGHAISRMSFMERLYIFCLRIKTRNFRNVAGRVYAFIGQK